MTFRFVLQLVGMFVVPLAAVIIPVLIGQNIGLYWSKKQTDIPHESIGSVVSAAFGLLAFMLAFTFQIAANRYEGRKTMLLEETKDIRIAYMRSGLLPEPFCTNSKNHLMDYVNVRAELAMDHSILRSAIARSRVILDSLWKYSEQLAVQDRSSEVYALYTTSINDLVDGLNDRITMVLVYRIPFAIIWVLFIMVFLSMLALGYQFGVTGKESFGINMLLATIFAVVMFLINALDRPERGLISVDPRPLFTLQKELNGKQMNTLNFQK